MKTQTTCLLGIVILNLALLTSQATSRNPVFSLPGGSPEISGNPNALVNLGMIFTPTANTLVNALGCYDTPGLTAGKTVAIYKSSGHLGAQSNVSLAGLLADSYYWNSISPVALMAGQSHIADIFTGNNLWAYGGHPAVNSQITYVDIHQVYDSTVGLSFPTATAGQAPSAYHDPHLTILSGLPGGGLTAGLLGGALISVRALRRKLSR